MMLADASYLRVGFVHEALWCVVYVLECLYW